MAEGLLRQLGGNAFETRSAGSKPNGYVSPLAIEAMGKSGLTFPGSAPNPLRNSKGRNSTRSLRFAIQLRKSVLCFRARSEFIGVFAILATRQALMKSGVAFCRVRDELASRLRQFLAERGHHDGATAKKPRPLRLLRERRSRLCSRREMKICEPCCFTHWIYKNHFEGRTPGPGN